MNGRGASAAALQLTTREYATLARLHTPERIQYFLNGLPANFEPGGETVHSVRNVLRYRVAHCIEGALLAACALWVNGEPPLVAHLSCAAHDNPHVIALFRRRGCWGALSKSNGAWLRYREPVYRSLRELAMSYFHEFFDRRGRKTLRGYSGAFDMRRIPPSQWVTNADSCADVDARLSALRHYPLVSSAQARKLSRRDAHERRAAQLVQYRRAGH